MQQILIDALCYSVNALTMKRHRFSFTLMEVLIGISLTALVMGMVFIALYQQVTMKSKLEKGETFVMERVHLQQRLDKVFATIEDNDLRGKNPLVLTQENSLDVLFDNGIDPEPPFCDQVKGSLSLSGGQLIFKIEGKGAERVEILKKNVHSIRYDFLTVEKDEVVEVQAWDRNYPPLYVKITLSPDEAYAFWVNTAHEGIPIKEKEQKKKVEAK